MELRLVVERLRENRLLCPDANSPICDLMFSCSPFLLVELLLLHYVFFRSSHRLWSRSGGGAPWRRNSGSWEVWENLRNFIHSRRFVICVGRHFGRGEVKKGRRGWWHGGRVCCYLSCWHCAGTNLAYLRWAFFISSLQFSHFFSLSETAISGSWFSPFLSLKVLHSFGLGCSSR